MNAYPFVEAAIISKINHADYRGVELIVNQHLLAIGDGYMSLKWGRYEDLMKTYPASTAIWLAAAHRDEVLEDEMEDEL